MANSVLACTIPRARQQALGVDDMFLHVCNVSPSSEMATGLLQTSNDWWRTKCWRKGKVKGNVSSG